MRKLIPIFLISFFILVNPVSAKVFVTEPSNGIITAPAASFTNSQMIYSAKNPDQAVLNYINGKETIVVGDITMNGEHISGNAESLAKYWTTSDVVVLGTGNDVSAALIAIKNKAPLLVAGNTLPQSTINELNRLKPKKVIICASSPSIPDSAFNTYPNVQKERVWEGNDENTLIKIQNGNKKIKAPKSLLPVSMVTWNDASFETGEKVTVDGNTVLWSSNDIITSIVINRYKNNDLPVIYLACDNLISKDADKALLNKIKDAISGSAVVYIDEKSPKPGEAPRTVQNAPKGIAAYIAAADPGSMIDLIVGLKNGYLKKDAQKLDGIVFINYGRFNLENTSYLSRAWDDDYSSVFFAGLYNPSSFLNDAGIKLIQPNVGTNGDNEEVQKTASGLIDTAYSSNKNQLNSNYDQQDIAKHDMNPTELSHDSQKVLDNKTPTRGTSKWMYLISQYVSGYPIQNTSDNISDTDKTGEITYFGVLTRDEYREAGQEVYEFMKTNKSIPKKVTVDGKTLSRADFTYLFANITSTHTSKKNMTFTSSIFINQAQEPFEIISKFLKSLFYNNIMLNVFH